MGTALNSSLYDCEVVHERLVPKRHQFRYRLFFMDLNLAELPELSRRLLLFSHNRANLYSFRDSDHLDLGQKGGLRDSLGIWLEGKGIRLRTDDRIRLVTLPRILGYIFNPVCFYFIYSEGKAKHVIVEVCNTFRELKPYLIDSPETAGYFRLTTPKHFYVSPFSSLTAEFDFRVRVPGDDIEIHIDDRENGETTLVSWIRGKQQPLTNARLAWYAIRFPAQTVFIIVRIHWQAFRLWLKKLPVFRKHADPDLQRDLFRPHANPNQTITK
jgi:DUF1365 family protein